MTLISQKHWLHFRQLAHSGAGGVIIAKTDEEQKLFVTSNTSDQSVFYTVSTDVAKFNFSGKKFAILSYDNFRRYFNSCQVSTKDNSGLPVLKTVNDDEGEPAPGSLKCQMCDYASLCAFSGFSLQPLESIVEEFEEEYVVRDVDHLEEKVDRRIESSED